MSAVLDECRLPVRPPLSEIHQPRLLHPRFTFWPLPSGRRRFSAQLMVKVSSHHHLAVVPLLRFSYELAQLLAEFGVYLCCRRVPVLQCYSCCQGTSREVVRRRSVGGDVQHATMIASSTH